MDGWFRSINFPVSNITPFIAAKMTPSWLDGTVGSCPTFVAVTLSASTWSEALSWPLISKLNIRHHVRLRCIGCHWLELMALLQSPGNQMVKSIWLVSYFERSRSLSVGLSVWHVCHTSRCILLSFCLLNKSVILALVFFLSGKKKVFFFVCFWFVESGEWSVVNVVLVCVSNIWAAC